MARSEIDEAIAAVSRSLSSADKGHERDADLYVPMAAAIVENMPDDWCIVPNASVFEAERLRVQTDPRYAPTVLAMKEAARKLLREFLDPHTRSVALGELAVAVRNLERIEFQVGEQINGRRE